MSDKTPVITSEQAKVSSGNVPPWVLKAGFVIGVLTLIFFMALILLAVFGHEVPKDSRFLVVAVFSFGAALSSSFLGGHAAANGHIPLPFAKSHPVAFSVLGGVAVLIILMVLGHLLYIRSGRV